MEKRRKEEINGLRNAYPLVLATYELNKRNYFNISDKAGESKNPPFLLEDFSFIKNKI